MAHRGKLAMLVEQHAVISFDVFDTALLRPLISPSDLFLLIEPEIRRLTGDWLLEFQRLRVEAEAEARRRAPQQEDVTLDEIYSVLQAASDLDDERLAMIQQAELEAERAVCFANGFIRQIYDHARQHVKRIIFVSDSYLPAGFVATLLQGQGYREYERLYVSSDLGKTKARGSLYAHISKDLACPPASILHIGDNRLADVLSARMAGVTGYHVPSCSKRFYSSRRNRSIWQEDFFFRNPLLQAPPRGAVNAAHSVVVGLIANRLHQDPDLPASAQASYVGDWYRFGYYAAGALYAAFVAWLIRCAREQGIDRLYFLAREGRIMQQAYEILAPCFPGAPPAEYLHASRRGWNLARITRLDTPALQFLTCEGGNRLLAGQYLERVGLVPEDYREQMNRAGIAGPEQRMQTPADFQKLGELFRAIAPDVLGAAERERAVLMRYFRHLGLDRAERIGIVDIGWRCTMQQSLVEMLRLAGWDSRVAGFYLGTFEQALPVQHAGSAVHSYLFAFGEPVDHFRSVRRGLEIYELIFAATQGSLVTMQEQGGEFVPVLDYSDCDERRVRIIEELQQGGLDFVRQVKPVMQLCPNFVIPPSIATRALKRLVLDPTWPEIDMFRGLEHTRNLDLQLPLVNRTSLLQLYFAPWRFARDNPDVLWWAAFRKQLGPLGWYYFYCLYRLYELYTDRDRLLARSKTAGRAAFRYIKSLLSQARRRFR